jgi:hypothetical protein
MKDLFEFIAKHKKIMMILSTIDVFKSTLNEVNNYLNEIPDKYDDVEEN